MASPMPTVFLIGLLLLALAGTLGLHFARGGDFPSHPMEIADAD